MSPITFRCWDSFHNIAHWQWRRWPRRWRSTRHGESALLWRKYFEWQGTFDPSDHEGPKALVLKRLRPSPNVPATSPLMQRTADRIRRRCNHFPNGVQNASHQPHLSARCCVSIPFGMEIARNRLRKILWAHRAWRSDENAQTESSTSLGRLAVGESIQCEERSPPDVRWRQVTGTGYNALYSNRYWSICSISSGIATTWWRGNWGSPIRVG